MTERRPPKKTETLEVRLSHESKRAFLEACRAEGRTASEVVRGFVDGYLRRSAFRRRLRDRFKPDGSLSMILKSKAARGGTVAAAGALGLLAFAVTPSAAEIDFRAMFDAIDKDGDGRVSLEEFAAPHAPGAGEGGLMIIRGVERRSVDGAVTESREELWIPAGPVSDADASESREVGGEPSGDRVVRIVRRIRDDAGEETVESLSGDGSVDVGEIEAELSRMREEDFARFDRDGDGAVDFAEFEARNAAMIEDTFRRLDADADGRLTSAELDAIPTIIAPGDAGQDKTITPMTRASFAALDRDGDGAVTREEFLAGPAR